jgi:hypothetical protein
MSFFLRQGWYVSFLELDLKTSPARTIREIARRGGVTPEAQEQLDRQIANGRGGLYLDLSPEQYRHLAAG